MIRGKPRPVGDPLAQCAFFFLPRSRQRMGEVDRRKAARRRGHDRHPSIQFRQIPTMFFFDPHLATSPWINQMAYVAPKTLARARELRKRLTDAETILWSRLRGLPGTRFRRQHPVGPFIADFACTRARLIVEIDGATHGTETERCYDAHRDSFLRSRGWRVVRIPNMDVYEHSDDVVSMICDLADMRMHRKSRGGI